MADQWVTAVWASSNNPEIYAKRNVCKTTDKQISLSMILKCISCARITLNVNLKRIIITLLLAEEP